MFWFLRHMGSYHQGWTCISCPWKVKRWSLNHWTSRDVPSCLLIVFTEQNFCRLEEKRMWKTGNMKCFTCAQLSPGDQHWAGGVCLGVQAIPCLTAALLYSASQILRWLQVGLWQPCVEQVYCSHSSNRICSLHVSASHFDNSGNVSSFPLFLYFLWDLLSMIFGVAITKRLELVEGSDMTSIFWQ